MKKRSTSSNGKPSASDLLTTPAPHKPLPISPSPNNNNSPSSSSFEFHTAFATSASSKKNKKNNVIPMMNSSSSSSVTSISDLKNLTARELDSIKCGVERSHNEIIKDVGASNSRLHKRFKIQTQACQQAIEEAEREYKKMSERLNESRDAMKASYAELIAEAQASANSVLKTSIPEISQSFKKAVGGLHIRYGIQSN